MAGMRDVAIHDYSDLKIERIFNTIQNDIPTLKKQIDAIEIEWSSQNPLELYDELDQIVASFEYLGDTEN